MIRKRQKPSPKEVLKQFGTGEQRRVLRVGRNQKCPCGSGRKYKDCHLSEGEAYLQKLAQRLEKDQVRRSQKLTDAQQLPWYRRIWKS